MRKKIFLNYLLNTIVLLGIVSYSTAQQQNANWYFGNEAGLDFSNTQSPSALSNSRMSTNGGSASVSDEDGNLLFYTNGINVWNKEHEIMPNGSGLYGSTTVSQSVVIVPMPGDNDKYYVITNQGPQNGSLGLNYSVVDMSSDDDDHDDDDHDDSKLSTGVVTGVSSSWKTVTLPENYNSMVVIATPNYNLASTDPMVVRIRNASGNSFQVRADSPGGTTSEIDVHFMVVEEGVYDGMEAVKYNSTVTAQNNSWVGENRTYANSYEDPVVLGQVMTYNDEGFSVFWSYGNSRSKIPNTNNLHTGKHVGEDTDTSRNDETIGYIVIESGSGSLNGISYTAAVGSDKITNKEKQYNIDHSGAEVAVATLSAMDGTDGGWAVLSGGSPVSESKLTLSIDEDIIKDSDNYHTTEQVAYIVFSTEDSDDDYEYCNTSETKVSICHNGNTLCVSINALQAHLDHGDSLGSCDDDDDDDDDDENSLGHVISNQKNIQLLPYSSEKLTVAINETDNSYWVVSFAPRNDPSVSDTFYSFKIDESGINLFTQSSIPKSLLPSENTGGQMKISPDLKNLAFVNNIIEKNDRYGITAHGSGIHTFDFDYQTGKVFNMDAGLLLTENAISYYGLEFSSDSNMLYVTSISEISNRNVYPVTEVEYGKLIQIPYRIVGQEHMPTVLYEGSSLIYGLQLAIDGKIYAVNANGVLSTIKSPNTEGFGSNFEYESISLNSKKATRELPQLVPNLFNNSNTPEAADVSSNNKSMHILGNPVKNELRFKLEEVYSLEIYNSQGIKVKSELFNDISNNDIHTVDISNLFQDTYFLVIKDKELKTYYKTIIKI